MKSLLNVEIEGPNRAFLQKQGRMLVKVEPSDSGGSFESAIVPRIRQTLLEPSKLQVGMLVLWWIREGVKKICFF